MSESSFHSLSGFKMRVLLTVYDSEDEAPHGLDLKEQLEQEVYGEDALNHGEFYQCLGELVDDDYVEKSIVDSRTNRYSVTEHGEAVCKEYREWVRRKVRQDREIPDRGDWV